VGLGLLSEKYQLICLWKRENVVLRNKKCKKGAKNGNLGRKLVIKVQIKSLRCICSVHYDKQEQYCRRGIQRGCKKTTENLNFFILGLI